MSFSRLRAIVLSFLFLAFCSGSALAAPLLTIGAESQLETWLGQGDLTFTNIFTKAPGDDALDFHAAADGKGATFTLLEAVYQGQTYVIGGYDPLSWSSTGSYNFSLTDPERTAFIYNLSTGVKQDQRLTSDPDGSALGQYQTFDHPFYGPTFGGGHDLDVDFTLTAGYAWQFSYGLRGVCPSGGTNLLGTTTVTTPCHTYNGNPYQFSVSALEVYTFAPTAVPEPASLLLLGTGLVAGWRSRRRK